MNPINRWRRRPRAVSRPAAEDVALDWPAVALAIWLACMVVVQLVIRAPQLPVEDAAAWPVLSRSAAAR